MTSQHHLFMGSKRARPWSRQSNGSSGSAVAVAAAATFALAALSVQEAGALSLIQNQCVSAARPRSAGACTGKVVGGDGSATTAGTSTRHRSKHRHRSKEGVMSSSVAGGSIAGAAVSRGDHGRRNLRSPSSSPSLSDDQAGRSGKQNNGNGTAIRHGDGTSRPGCASGPSLGPVMSATEAKPPPVLPRSGGESTISVHPTHVLEQKPASAADGIKSNSDAANRSQAPPPIRGRGRSASLATPSRSAAVTFRHGKLLAEKSRGGNRQGKKKGSLNDVRMFLMERGLSRREVRKVLPIMRRDPELVTDIAVLAARMQAIADLLEAAASWHATDEDRTAMEEAAQALETTSGDSLEAAGNVGRSPDSTSVATENGKSFGADRKSENRGNTRQQQVQEGRVGCADTDSLVAAALSGAVASAGAAAPLLTNSVGSGGDGGVELPETVVAKAVGSTDTPVARLHHPAFTGGAGGEELEDGLRWRSVAVSSAKVPAPSPAVSTVMAATDEETEVATDVAAVMAAVSATREEGEGIRLYAYQLISSEPRLLLLRAEPTLAERLRFLLDKVPGLRRGNARLRRAAPLLAIDTATLEGRFEGLARIFPACVDVEAVVNQAPLLLRHRTEIVSNALVNAERLVPGLRMDRVLRSAPQLLVQPLDVVEKRLGHLRAVLGLSRSPELERMLISMDARKSGGPGGEGGGGGKRKAGFRTLARFANAFPQILTMEPHAVRAKIEGLEVLLPGMDGLAVVGSRPHLLGFSVRHNVSQKVSGLRALMKHQGGGPAQSQQQQQQHKQQQEQEQLLQDLAAGDAVGNDLAAVVTRCPSLLTLSSDTAMKKMEKFQEVLPPGVDARTVVAKEPRVMALDMRSTVPRKLKALASAFAEHAHANGEEAAAMVAQVLSYYPNALRFDSETLADKLKALRRAGLTPETIVAVVGGAPRCLSAAAETLERRVTVLKEAFPSIPLSRLVGGAPCLLQNKIDTAAKVEVLRELFPSLDPVCLVKGAPMLLSLSKSTLRAKGNAWRSVLEGRMDVPWEEAIVQFPQILSQGLGRSARVAFLLLPGDLQSAAAAAAAAGASSSSDSDSITSAAAMAAVQTRAEPTENTAGRWNKGETTAERGGGDGDGGEGTRLSAAEACREICKRASDFEVDHPGYSCFLDSMLLTAGGRFGDGGDGGGGNCLNGSDMGRSENEGQETPALPPSGFALGQRIDGAPVSTATLAGGSRAAAIISDGESRAELPMPSNADKCAQQHVSMPPPPSLSLGPLASPTPRRHPAPSAPADVVRVVVRSEKALGAAMMAAAKGPGGGREAASMVLMDEV